MPNVVPFDPANGGLLLQTEGPSRGKNPGMRSSLVRCLVGVSFVLLAACDSGGGGDGDPCRGVVCRRGQECVQGKCVDREPPEPEGCETNADCMFHPDGEFCDRVTKRCVACFTDSHCHPARTCRAGRCEGTVCTTDDDCGADAPFCNAAGDACLACLRDDHCEEGFVCRAGACVSERACGTDEDCAEPTPYCVDGICSACRDDGDCPAGQGCAADRICRDLSCSTDADCSAFEGRSCRGGQCRVGECDVSEECPDDRPYCVENACVRCTSTEGCPAGQACVGGETCEPIACDVLEDCPVGSICEDENCQSAEFCDAEADCLDPRLPHCLEGRCVRCVSGESCGPWEVCEGGECVPFAVCGADSHCRGGFVCEDGGCVSCRADSQCPRGVCVDGICSPAPSCTSDAQCPGGACDRGVCVGCVVDGDCRPGQFCVDGACTAGPLCHEGAGCPPGQVCDAGTCVPAGCADDALEPDGGPALARPIGLRTPESRTICPGDEDWFVFQAAEGVQMEISLAEAPEGVELALIWFSPGEERRRMERVATHGLLAGGLPAAAANRYFVVVRSAEASGDYVLLVEPAQGCRDALEPEDTPAQAVDLEPGRLYEGLRLCNFDHYRLAVPAQAQARFYAFFGAGSLDIQVFHDGTRLPVPVVPVGVHGGGRSVTIPPASEDRTLVFRLATQGSNPAPDHYGIYAAVEPPASCSAGILLLDSAQERARVRGTTAGSRLSLSGACGALSEARTYLVQVDRPSRLVASIAAEFPGARLALFDASCGTAVACRNSTGEKAVLDVPELSPGTYVLAVAAGAAGGGWYDLGVQLDEPLPSPANDLCEDAHSLDLSSPVVVQGSTVGAGSDFLAVCTALAPDVFYEFALGEPSRVVFDLRGDTPHTLVLVEDACDQPHAPTSPCWSEARKELELPAGTYRLGVLATSGRAGPFELGIQVVETPANDRCEDAIPILTSGTLTGDTTWARDHSSYPIQQSCTGYLLGGHDVFYAVSLAAGQTLSVTVTPDPAYDVAVYVRSSCDAGASCLAGADAGLKGEAETLSFTALADGTYLLVVDGASGGGPFQMQVQIQ